jgi:hypothetical protein
MTTLLMHIGGPKTGTTFIQQLLFENRKFLSDFCIGPAFNDRNHFQLALVGAEEAARKRFYKWGKTSAEDFFEFERSVRSQLIEAAEKYNFSYITSEFLFQDVSTPQGVSRVASVIHDIFDRVILVAFVRRPEFLIIPYYSTQVKAGRSIPIESDELLGSKTLMQSKKINMWRKHFKADEFKIFPYFEGDSSASLMNRFLSSFEHRDFGFGLQVPKARVNQSLTRIGLESMRILNSMGENWPSDKRAGAVRFIEFETKKYGKAGLTEQQYVEARKFCEAETLELEEMLENEDRSLFRNHRPARFSSIGQDLIPQLFSNQINDLILRASTGEQLKEWN